MVVIKDIGVVEQGPLERTDLTLPFDFNVAVEMFPLALQYGLAYPNIEADAQIKIKCYMGPMIIQMTHRDYMFIMKCLFHNIAYDDGFDIMIKNENPKHYAAFFRD
jgi:vacuolar protein sorting-associated protein 13A/C